MLKSLNDISSMKTVIYSLRFVVAHK